jgi:tRNA modification GTPase
VTSDSRRERNEACLLTPPGAGALAVIALRGPRVWSLVSPYFQSKRQPVLRLQPTLTFGTLSAEERGDEIVLRLQGDAAGQYLELQLHGGPGVVAWCMRFMEELGIHHVPWTEWLHDDAERLLPLAMTKKTASFLLDQCGGAFAQRLRDMQSLPDRQSALQQVNDLLSWSSLGLHLVKPWQVLLAGPPNVGKSSLLNALAGYQRAITSETPGTTRDLVSAMVVCDGYPLEFIDSAGLRACDDLLEQAGIERTQSVSEEADVILWLVDESEVTPPPPTLQPTFTIVTKADLPRQHTMVADHSVSAVTGEGVAALLARVKQHLLPVEPPPGQVFPLTLAHVEQLRQLQASLQDTTDN